LNIDLMAFYVEYRVYIKHVMLKAEHNILAKFICNHFWH